MRIQTILNYVEKFKSFVYGEASLEERGDGPALKNIRTQRARVTPYLPAPAREQPSCRCKA
jgi:hypothetical protein